MSGGLVWPGEIEVVDSHTGGEPTRVVVRGWPRLAGESMTDRRRDLTQRYDRLRRAVVGEPRGHDAMVGAVLTEPTIPASAAGVIFFNNTGTLGMCGHGLMGVVRTLEFLGRISGGEVRLDTPVGPVSAQLEPDGQVTIENVPAFCHALDVPVDVPGMGRVRGDIAWGGNWFFLTELDHPRLTLSNVAELTGVAARIARALSSQGITGRAGEVIDHVELFGPPALPDADSRNFVLCPGLAYDRSPCGTGTSAKMAVLAARGKLRPGQLWRQESITGSLFTGWLEERGRGDLVPRVSGRAFVTSRATLYFNEDDPFREGLTAGCDRAASGGAPAWAWGHSPASQTPTRPASG